MLAFFNMTNQRAKRQPQALAGAVLASVSHLDKLHEIKGPLDLIVHKHCALGVLPEHYKIVHDNFLGATAEVLGDAVTDEVAGAWSEVLMYLATSLIGMEEAVYQQAEKRVGGWRGIKDFKVTKVVKEAEDITSLSFAPADGSTMPEFTPGQYLTVCENPTTEPLFAPRHYTISSADELRITTKICKTDGHPDGVMSKYLNGLSEGDIVKLRPPFGTESIDKFKDAEGLVFVTGGSGVTPAAALSGAAAKVGLKFVSIHAGHSHPLHSDIVANAGGNTDAVIAGDRSVLAKQSMFDAVKNNGLDANKVKFFVSGPPPMMSHVVSQLTEGGVDKANISWTAFGPAVNP